MECHLPLYWYTWEPCDPPKISAAVRNLLVLLLVVMSCTPLELWDLEVAVTMTELVRAELIWEDRRIMCQWQFLIEVALISKVYAVDFTDM